MKNKNMEAGNYHIAMTIMPGTETQTLLVDVLMLSIGTEYEIFH